MKYFLISVSYMDIDRKEVHATFGYETNQPFPSRRIIRKKCNDTPFGVVILFLKELTELEYKAWLEGED